MVEADPCFVCQSVDLINLFQIDERQYVKCCQCGLVFLKGISKVKAKAVYKTDAYQMFESRHRLGFREAIYQKSLKEIERVKKSGRLLDVGCGDGLFLSLANKRGWETYGVEISPMASEHAKNVFHLNITHGELHEARFPDTFFDVVTLFNVLDHFPCPLDELLEIRRILKDGGLLVLRVPNTRFHVNLIRILKSLEHHLVFHLYCFSPKTIRYLLEKMGYRKIYVKNSPLTPSDPYSVSPFLGDWGMHLIKETVYFTAQVVYYSSARKLIIGPSLMAHAIKAEEEQRFDRR